jgi:hypothetical protein
MVWYGTVRYGTVRYGTVRYGTVRYGTVRYGTVRYGTVRYGTVRYDTVPTTPGICDNFGINHHMFKVIILWFGCWLGTTWLEICGALWIPPHTFSLIRKSNMKYKTKRLSHSQDEMNPKNGLRFGVLGCGTIGSAFVRGILTQTQIPIPSTVAVTIRSESKSSALRNDFPSVVTCYESPQTVLDTSDWILLSVLPEQASPLVQSLTWDPSRHFMISLVVRFIEIIIVFNQQTEYFF